MGVDLGGADIRMPEQLLNRPDIRTMRKHMRCEAVAQDMRRYLLRIDAHRHRSFLNDLENPLPRERFRKPRHEHMRLREIPFREEHAGPFQIIAKCSRRRPTDWHQPLLGSFAEDAHEFAVRHYILGFERTELGDAHSAAVEDFENRTVTERARIIAVHRIQHRKDLLFGQRLWQRATFLRRIQKLRRIVSHDPLLLEIAEPLTDRRGSTGTSRRCHSVLALGLKKPDNILARDFFRGGFAALLQKRREEEEIAFIGDAGIGCHALLEHQRRNEVLDVSSDHNRETKSSMKSRIRGFAALPASMTS